MGDTEVNVVPTELPAESQGGETREGATVEVEVNQPAEDDDEDEDEG